VRLGERPKSGCSYPCFAYRTLAENLEVFSGAAVVPKKEFVAQPLEIREPKVANLVGGEPRSVRQAWRSHASDDSRRKCHENCIDPIGCYELKNQVAAAFNEDGLAPHLTELVEHIDRRLRGATDRAPGPMSVRVEVWPKHDQLGINITPLVADLIRNPTSRQHGIYQRSPNAVPSQLGRLHDRMRTHSVGLTTNEHRIGLGPEKPHTAPVFIRSHVEVVVTNGSNATIQAHGSVGEDSHEVT